MTNSKIHKTPILDYQKKHPDYKPPVLTNSQRKRIEKGNKIAMNVLNDFFGGIK